MKLIIYNFLVNTHPGIRDRYHAFHDQAYGIRRYLSWLYLLALNFGYYVLHLRSDLVSFLQQHWDEL